MSIDIRDAPLPDEMRALLSDYPRDGWEAHPHLRAPTRQWLRAHQMFRRVSKEMRQDAEAFLNGDAAPRAYARRLSSQGGRLVGSLHAHHAWEDYEYFPELSAADPRFEAGLAVLEQDHETLDGVLNQLTETALNALPALRRGEDARDAVGRIHRMTEGIEALLARHLADEEDLAVPIILHYRLRG